MSQKSHKELPTLKKSRTLNVAQGSINWKLRSFNVAQKTFSCEIIYAMVWKKNHILGLTFKAAFWFFKALYCKTTNLATFTLCLMTQAVLISREFLFFCNLFLLLYLSQRRSLFIKSKLKWIIIVNITWKFP